MKIAIAEWNGYISPLFDVSEKLLVVHIENGKEIKREDVFLKKQDFFGRAKELSEIGVDVLICGAISYGLETAILNKGINVIGFICGDVENILEVFKQQKQTINDFFMPGCNRRQIRHRFQHRRRNRFP